MRPRWRGLGWLGLALAAACATAACQRSTAPTFANFGGDPARGAVAIDRAACGSCHEIPGVSNANGMVGPPLDHMAERTMVAGLLPNTPANLVRWIQQPQSVVPGNAMPNATLTDQDARDVAAYLYTLR